MRNYSQHSNENHSNYFFSLDCNSQAPASDAAVEQSTGLFDSSSQMFLVSVTILCCLLGAAVMVGLCYHFFIYVPRRKKGMTIYRKRVIRSWFISVAANENCWERSLKDLSSPMWLVLETRTLLLTTTPFVFTSPRKTLSVETKCCYYRSAPGYRANLRPHKHFSDWLGMIFVRLKCDLFYGTNICVQPEGRKLRILKDFASFLYFS